MQKILEGTITYKITLSTEADAKVDYNSSPENDIAALIIAETILSSTANYYIHLKNTTTGKYKASVVKLKLFTNTANVLKKGRTAMNRIINMLLENLDGYLEHKEELEAKKDEKHEEIKKYFNDNNISVETGMLSPEQVDELLKDKFKDLKASPSHEEVNKAANEAQDELVKLRFEKKETSPDENLTNL